METKPLFPWYKERLQTKYGRAPTNTLQAVGGRQSSANPSSNDSRELSSVFHEEQRGAAALYSLGGPPSRNPRRSIPKEYACFSKQMIQKQTRREYVSSLEEKLKQHPLVMYPHYKDHLTPELFDQVVSILDPDMCANNTYAPSRDHTEENDEEKCAELQTGEENHLKQSMKSPDGQNQSLRNPHVVQMKAHQIKKEQEATVNHRETPTGPREKPTDLSGNVVSLRMKRRCDSVINFPHQD